jgi:transcriptional regulator with PAS, ATPase and Fis domain
VRGPDRGRSIELGERCSALIGTHPSADLPLSDPSVSRRHAELYAEEGGYALRDLGSTNGIVLGGLRIREVLLLEQTQTFALGETHIEFAPKGEALEQPVSASERFGDLIGRSATMRGVFELLSRVAPTDSTVLIQGESGTGKEAVAESIHAASTRAEGPFVVVDCSAIAADLFEAELFGVERGAFTGADRSRRGLAEEAHGGTLFLDEIGELPLELQPRLLRLIESRELRRVGAIHPTPIDVRVIAATHRPLLAMTQAGSFRSDLYHRLAVVKVDVPPLRYHREDVALLADHLVAQLRPGFDAQQLLTPEIVAALSAHVWPGNVRELKNVIERLLSAGELASSLRATAPTEKNYALARRDALDRFEKEYCESLLELTGGNVVRAAEAAGISRQTFHRMMAKHAIHGR